MTDGAQLRIGELSRRSGVSPELLRAWERRYGLLRPARSTGGLRLYSEEDLERVLAMRHHLAEGVAAAEAARFATDRGERTGTAAFDPVAARSELDERLMRFEEAGAEAVVERLLATASLDSVLRQVVLPYLHEVGDRWQRGEVTIAQEHFASSLLRARLLALGRGWGRGFGPAAVLACAPREQHDLGLIAFALALRARGWRIVYLGADMPLESVADAARSTDPAFVVISSVSARRFRSAAEALADLARDHRVCLGGAGAATAGVAGTVLTLGGDAVDEAERLTQLASEAPERARAARHSHVHEPAGDDQQNQQADHDPEESANLIRS